MRILCFLPDFDGGGAQRTVINLANQFVANGQAVLLAATRTDGPARSWVGSGVEVRDLGCERTRAAIWPLARLIRQWHPDILFSTMIDANIAAWAARALAGGKGTALVVRETNSHIARDDLGRLSRLMMRRAYARADRVVALSRGVGDELVDLYGFDRSRVATIHNPVAVSHIARRVEAARRKPSPIPGEGPVLLGIGRLTRQKGFERLLRIVARLPQSNARVVLLGQGTDKAVLEKQAEALGLRDRLYLPGFVEDATPWLAHADIFVLPSRWEGFGHVIVEAMASGLPVVAFDCPHGPRDLIVDGENGFLVDDGDEDAFGRAVAAILSDAPRASQLAKSARKLASERWEVSRIADEYLELFALVAAERTGNSA